jgi:hypothetical protein
MKLKKPITVTIDDDALAVAIAHFCNEISIRGLPKIDNDSFNMAVSECADRDTPQFTLWREIKNNLLDMGINYLSWKAVKPIRIANNEVKFDDSGITFGDTTIPKETILEIAKRFQ